MPHVQPKTITGFNIAEFTSRINISGVLKPTKFLFKTPVPTGVQSVAGPANGLPLTPENTEAARDMRFWASSAQIPGAVLAAQDISRFGYGPTVKYPFAPIFGPFQVTFIADGLGTEWKFFKEWMNLTVFYQGGLSNRGILSVSPINGLAQSLYEVAYPIDYCVDNAEITAFVDSGEPILRVTMRETYPIAVSDMKMDWSDKGGPATFNVNFQYTDWSFILNPTP